MNDVKKDKSSSNEGGDYEFNPKRKSLNRDSSQDQYKSKERLQRDISNEDFSASSSKMQQRHKRQWKAPETKLDEKQIVSGSNQLNTFGNQADNNKDKDYNSNKMTVPDKGNSNNSSLSPKDNKQKFGSKKEKKNVFNPFAKKTPGNSISKQPSAEPQPVSTNFGNFEGGGNNRFGTGGFGGNQKETTGFSNNDSKISSQPSNFDSKIKPVALNETGPLNFSGINNKNGKSDSGSGIAEQISDNYDDDDFEVSYA